MDHAKTTLPQHQYAVGYLPMSKRKHVACFCHYHFHLPEPPRFDKQKLTDIKSLTTKQQR
jgi:hypothetical protein